ncbi:MAG: zinc ABC transporter substrate-binding protein [Ignavibacteria bacterium]|nr:zinc ABC transporter substrate-binding protein [Ignavibacteria bacterium]
MKHYFSLIIILLIVSVFSLYADSKIKVVTTLPDLKSITEEIGGDKVDVFAIATGYQNPHFVDPKPSYILKLAKADLFVTVGLDLETGWVPPLLNSARNAKIQKGSEGYIDASTNVPLLQVPSSVNRAEGDIHIYGNPHFWIDPVRGKQIAENIFQGLVKASPDNQNYFQTNLKTFNDRIDTKTKEWITRMAPYKGSKIIAYHNEWPYFEERFGLKIVDFLEPKPGIPPSPNQLVKVIGEIKRENIKVIISSPYFTTESADLVARQTGAKVVVLATSVGAEEHIKTFFDLFDYNVNKLVEAFK